MFLNEPKNNIGGTGNDKVYTGQCVKVFAGHTDSVGSVRFSADGKHVVTSSEDGTVMLWE